MDNELILFDRLNVIRDIDKKYDLQNNAYLSFSGGKDSTILHYLIDMALPGNKIPRVFIDTGIEYADVRHFALDFCVDDPERFWHIRPSENIKEILEKYGYPFKSKEHSLRVDWFNRGSNANFVKKYIDGSAGARFSCPKILKYQFAERGKYHYSNLCCRKLKKEPAHKWAKEHNKNIVITGMRSAEGGNRAHLGCVITDSKGRLLKFHPLIKVDDAFEDWFVRKYRIVLCDLYYSPFKFKRTGCKGCPFALDLQEQLSLMEKYLPYERIACENIWKPVYSEYRRIGYRLDANEQLKLF